MDFIFRKNRRVGMTLLIMTVFYTANYAYPSTRLGKYSRAALIVSMIVAAHALVLLGIWLRHTLSESAQYRRASIACTLLAMTFLMFTVFQGP
ncbi:hypothetical protein [Schlesneria paludicola]|uniref:hypothetical protein n=1 Tax=Schlesneria paludicola TaxID=360056 RepID=UPI0004925F60|nr:hypothetical protein [Schlesneria paludicola]